MVLLHCRVFQNIRLQFFGLNLCHNPVYFSRFFKRGSINVKCISLVIHQIIYIPNLYNLLKGHCTLRSLVRKGRPQYKSSKILQNYYQKFWSTVWTPKKTKLFSKSQLFLNWVYPILFELHIQVTLYKLAPICSMHLLVRKNLCTSKCIM